MKRFVLFISLLILLFLLTLWAQDEWMEAKISPVIVGGGVAAAGCTVANGDLINESFEAGTTPSGWNDGAAAPTYGDALPGTNPCSPGLGSGSVKIVWSTGATVQATYRILSRSYSDATTYFRFYLYVDSITTNATDFTDIWAYEEGTTGAGNSIKVTVNKSGSDIILQLTGTDTNRSAGVTISTATWYRIEVKYVHNSANGSEMNIYNAAGAQVGSTRTAVTNDSITPRTIYVGIGTGHYSSALTYHVDGIGASTTGYLGQ